MSKVAHYLQEHLLGEVMTGIDARRYFSTDASILTLTPALIVYPRHENDIRKTARFTWQLAERGRAIPITARGSGTDQTGAALGSGIIMVFPAHLNRILELDAKSSSVSVEPGINFGKLQQTLLTHNRFLPPYPASLEYSTVGGAVANNTAGEKSAKYGDMRGYVQKLRVVLANGEVIETGRISKRELNRKLGYATFEGEIYRSLDSLLEENQQLLGGLERSVALNNAGYSLSDIRRKDGSFDLTPLFVGSQGTLGIISEITLDIENHNPKTSLMFGTFASAQQAAQAALELRSIKHPPSTIEFVDGYLLEQAHKLNPNALKDVLKPPFPSAILLVEFDDGNDRQQKKAVKRAGKVFEQYALSLHTETDPDAQQLYWKIRQTSAVAVGHNESLQRALPILEGASIPPDQAGPFFEAVYDLCRKAGLQPSIWGNAGTGTYNLRPRLDIAQVGDRQKAMKLMDEYYRLVVSLGGTVSGAANDGRLHAPYAAAMYGPEVTALFQKVKQIFDPYNTLNPSAKLGTTHEDLRAMLRTSYGLEHFYEHLPRS